ncbi:hypothetical protein A3H80_00310 [Candidatus Roizmanbacteria bacterium RIFCSPLOWO2_02_FULL_37_19]|uniref:Rod shape-determining protein RodA n=1 Tax=Candidatus Roizmanbacteria bacterium RIFCSPHIGHO2_02_FULL_37_24 TaxID=1802037 RepID=A0A1F7GZ85_9BACT|nr:MAG: hypothetical protein A2862_04790 [Candidatus Roizmanbacteria bacterium RIFCSPHIGHO2_01_FULL_38_41]OGK24437.1 MAG: hypothetical protein A3C24_02020 [Candidatus Roizmanbacteria bacterium RIFCSPHIGHO2_02_FULL_37_24]OGK32651.1 MAG: hypothetical protein A3E10_01490 [Candidatus Roizmanbacteria bacterium RIFCSPHIGHO2_12_FULL_37_23]OGK44783.1 MAG: hypothetical protein A2956_01660 [Candidatus Roizmanbacteria bacterium RIFCSPLOWO2_01_FULL_37_57]OGK53965.1 MAG: hypothetical protein A3H80_00310 [Ca
MKKRSLDLWGLLSVVGLLIFGSFNILGIRPDLFLNYIFFSLLGLAFFVLFFRLKTHFFKDNYFILFICFVLLFILTALLGEEVRGAKRWINFFIFNFQTSEFYKPFFLLIMATLLSTHNRFMTQRIIVTFMAFFIPFIFVLTQPDLGSALMYLVVFFAMLFYSGYSTIKLLYISLAGFVGLPIGWQFLQNYQKLRIIGFINPDLDPRGITYNLHQAIITVGSGGLLGRGLGLSTQARHNFLPEFHTDFAFASLVEQFGFVGGLVVLLLYMVLLYRLTVKIFTHKNDLFAYLYLSGSLIFISLAIFVNVGMNLGILPVTGIALPFISYGGSSIVSTMIMLGLAFSI